jgi:hypothetical protein
MERKNYIVKILADSDKIDALNHKKDKVRERGLALPEWWGTWIG